MAAGTTRRRGADVLTRLSFRRDHTSQDRFARTEVASRRGSATRWSRPCSSQHKTLWTSAPRLRAAGRARCGMARRGGVGSPRPRTGPATGSRPRGRLQSSAKQGAALLELPVHGQAAGHADDLSGDEVGVVARKEGDDARDVLGLAEALQGDRALEALVDLLAVLTLADE